MRGFNPLPPAATPSSLSTFCLLACDPAPAPCFCSGADACALGADGLCCAGAEADDGELVAEGAAVSVSLRCARAGGQGSETVAVGRGRLASLVCPGIVVAGVRWLRIAC